VFRNTPASETPGTQQEAEKTAASSLHREDGRLEKDEGEALETNGKRKAGSDGVCI